MKFSCATTLLPELRDLAEIARLVKGAGYDAVDWRVQIDYHIPPDELSARAPSVRSICDDHGLEIGALRTYADPGDHELLKRLFAGAAELGCPRVRIGGFLYDGTRPYSEVFDYATRALDEVERLSAEAGVQALLEVHFGTIHCSPSGTFALVKDRNPKAIGVIADPSNMIIEGRENWQMTFEMLWDHLAIVDVRNTRWYSDGVLDHGWQWEWTPLDVGMVDWRELVTLLSQNGFAGFLTNENIYQVPTSSTGYIGERHDSLGGYEGHRSIEERLADLDYLKSLVPAGTVTSGSASGSN